MEDPKKRFTEKFSVFSQQKSLQESQVSDKENLTDQKTLIEKEPTFDQSKLMEETIENSQLKQSAVKEINTQKSKDLMILELQSRVKGIQQRYLDEGVLFEDKKFPALNQFLFQDDQQQKKAYQQFKTWQWLRPEQISVKSAFHNPQSQSNFEIRLGKFSSLQFANAISTLTNKNQYLKTFVDFEHMHMGYVICQFFKNGEWHYVIVDTLLPYSLETKKFLFMHHGSQDLFWVALLEKAYAKLCGSFSNIKRLDFKDILIDLCNCYITSFDLKNEEKQQFIHSKKLFPYLMNYQLGKQKYFLMCIKENQNTIDKQQIEMGEYGILENFAHCILSLEDVQQRDFKFFRIRNFWGQETNWSGPFSKNSDEWEKYKNLRDEFLNNKKYSQDGQNVYFMKYEYFVKEFNKIYIIKLFDDGNWFNYSYQGFWEDKSLSGPPDNINQKFPLHLRNTNKFTQLDSGNNWFNNPQFRIKVKKKTKLYVSLVQQDDSTQKIDYLETNFCVVQNKKSQQRIWEYPENSKIITTTKLYNKEDNDDQEIQKNNQKIFKRQIESLVVLDIFENKKHGNYTLIVNLDKIKSLKNKKIPFFVKIFSNNEIIFEELPLNRYQIYEGSWDNEKCGGQYYQNGKSHKLNPQWCINPQYVMNFTQPTQLKIILKKTGKNAKKMKTTKVGLTICYLHHDKNLDHYQYEIKKNKTKKDKKEKHSNFQNIQKFLTIPKLEIFQRKIGLKEKEIFIQSTYASSDIACLYLKLLPIEGPLLIVPSLEKQGLSCDYKMEVFSNQDIEIRELDYDRNPVIISQWTQYTSGGSHIYNEKLYKNPDKITWVLNPVFILKFENFEFFDYKNKKINIKFRICDFNWKSKLLQNKDKQKASFEMKKKEKKSMINVDCMICFYILKKADKLTTESIVYQTPFCTKSEIDYDFYYTPIDFDNQDELLIMPCTYNSGIETNFVLAAHCDHPISLSKIQLNFFIMLKMKIFFIILFAILNCKILMRQRNHTKDFKQRIIDRILAQKFPKKKSQRKLSLKLYKKKPLVMQQQVERKDLDETKPKFYPYNPIQIAFIGNYQMKVVPNQNLTKKKKK